MLEKILILLFAAFCIVTGINSIRTRQARFTLWRRSNQYREDEHDEHVTEGFAAILVGMFQIGVGVYVLIHRQIPW